MPSNTPSALPSLIPSLGPSSGPSVLPSTIPSRAPSSDPSSMPTSAPSAMPSNTPSALPSLIPTSSPSGTPSSLPTAAPSSRPSLHPTDAPSDIPSSRPTSSPSSSPTIDLDGLPLCNPCNKWYEDCCDGFQRCLQCVGFPEGNTTTGKVCAWNSAQAHDRCDHDHRRGLSLKSHKRMLSHLDASTHDSSVWTAHHRPTLRALKSQRGVSEMKTSEQTHFDLLSPNKLKGEKSRLRGSKSYVIQKSHTWWAIWFFVCFMALLLVKITHYFVVS